MAKQAPVPSLPARKATAVNQSIVVDTDDRAVAERKYAETVEGWADLPERQREAILSLSQSYRVRPQPLQVRLTRTEAGGYSIAPAEGDHASYHALKTVDAFATTSLAFSTDKLNDLLNHFAANNNRGAGELDLNSALAFLDGAKPKNEVEATLAVQMVATNDAAMRALAMVGKSEFIQHTQTFGNLAIKLLRTFAMQVEALAKLQRGGEQVVRHVHVDNRGGQAVITENVHTGGRGNGKVDDQSHATSAAGISPALLGADPIGNGVPISGREGEAAMQDARRDESRRA